MPVIILKAGFFFSLKISAIIGYNPKNKKNDGKTTE